MKRTYQPHNRKRINKHGFRKRISTRGGIAILKRRRLKCRKFLIPDERFYKGKEIHGRRVKNTVNVRKYNKLSRIASKNKLNSTTCRKAGM